MKVPALLVPVCLIVFVFGPACSREDQPAGPPPSPKVVQTIKPLPEPKGRPEAEAAQERQEMPGPELAQKQPGEKKTDQQLSAPPVEAAKEEPGVYVVKKGDTLARVAARQEIMQDPLKWIILLQLNLAKFSGQPIGADFVDRELTPGMRLQFVTPEAAKEGVEKSSRSFWAVNVMSGFALAEIVPAAVILAKEGFPAYITRATVKGKEYLRLRVGFFPNKLDAGEQGQKIRKLLGLEAFWTAKVTDSEYEEFAGFLKAL